MHQIAALEATGRQYGEEKAISYVLHVSPELMESRCSRNAYKKDVESIFISPTPTDLHPLLKLRDVQF